MLTLNSQNRCKTEIDTDVEKGAIMHMRLKKLIKDNLKSISRGTITIYFIIVQTVDKVSPYKGEAFLVH